MKTLFILNDQPYGNERSYNGLRLANALAKREGEEVRVLEIMLKTAARRGAEIGVCGTCMDARGLAEDALVEGTRRCTLEELAGWTAEAERVLVF